MIPKFPDFKKLEAQDKPEAEKFTQRLLPYSDFNFVSLWAWDIKGQVIISELHNNLVVRFTDYLTTKPFYSFLGDNNVNETAEALLELSKKEGLEPILKLIPEDAVLGLDEKKFEITEDRDNFDYIYSIEELKNLDGKKFSKKRNQVSSFLKNYPNAEARILDLKDKIMHDKILNLYNDWEETKLQEKENFESNEEIVLNRLLSVVDIFNLVGIGIFINDKLVAFFLDELTGSNYAIAHASKIDKSFAGVNSFLMKKNAEMLFSYGKTMFNYEQDLGIENLRDAKTRFRPTLFFKQYRLTYPRP